MNKPVKRYVILIILLLGFVIPLFTNQNSDLFKSTNQNNQNSTLKTSEDTLYANVDHTFHLDDYWDDSDPAHVYTGANFQKVYVPTTQQWDESVDFTSNGESWTPHNTGVSMINGTFGNQDYMHTDDNQYSTFTAKDTTTGGTDYDEPAQWGEYSFTKGSGTSTGETELNNGVYATLTSGSSESTEYGYDSPNQWGEYAFTKGSGTSTGELETNDNNYNILTSGSTTTYNYYYHTIRPDSDIETTDWTTTPLYSKINEVVNQPTAGTDPYITATAGTTVKDCTLGMQNPSGVTGNIVGITIWVYGMVSTTACSLGVRVYVGGTQKGGGNMALTTSYAWKSRVVSLTIAPGDVNDIRIYLYTYEQTTGYTRVRTAYFYMTEQRPSYTYSFDFTQTWAIPMDGTAMTFYYDYKTSSAITCTLKIYDWVAGSYNTQLQSQTTTNWISGFYDLTFNPSKVSGSGQVSIQFQTSASGSSFTMNQDQITVLYSYPTNIYSFDYTIIWSIPSGTALTLYYDYATSVAVDCDLDIWDYVAGNWNTELQSQTTTNWITSSYDLSANPNKVSGGEIKLRYQTATAVSSFQMFIDQLTIYYSSIVPGDSYLDFTVVSPSFSNINRDDLCALKITSNYYTNISTATTVKIWNFDSSTWVQCWSQTRTSETQDTYTITSNIDDFFNATGNMKLYFIGVDSDAFLLYVDYIQFLLVDKLDLSHTTNFNLVGEWKYRWEILGSVYYTQWVSFQVLGMANFEAISESDYTTRWILQNSTISPVMDFHDDINTDYWNLVDVASNHFDFSTVSSADAFVYSMLGDWNTGSMDYVVSGVYYVDPIGYYYYRSYYAFSGYNPNYLFTNQTGDDYIRIYADNQEGNHNYDLYTTTSFSELGITWNNKPSGVSKQDTQSIASDGYKNFYISNLGQYYMIQASPEDTNHAWYKSWSREYSTSSYRPYLYRDEINKNYFGGGYMYMQTNTGETIGLLSQDYGTSYEVDAGEYFTVELQTNSDSKIELLAYNNGVLQATYTVSPAGNTNFNQRTVQIVVPSDLVFDQLKFKSTFEDTDYLKVFDIKSFVYSLAGDYADFYLGSKRSKEIYLTPSEVEYNLRVYELGIEQVNINLTIGASGCTQYVYMPTEKLTSRVRLLTMENSLLNYVDYNTYVNRSLNGYYDFIPLYSDTFEVDVGTYAYFTVYDAFGSLVLSDEQELISDYINLNLNVYQLQIKNLQEVKTTIDINGTYVFPLLSGDSLYFTLSEAEYHVGYYNPNNEYKQFSFYLNSNQAYELNRSKMCFLTYVNQRGEYVSFNNYKTYLNGSLLYYNVFYKEVGDSIGIEIKDLFDISVKNETYTVVSGDNYIPIVLTQYSLKVKNSQEIFNHINITRDPETPYYWSEWLAPGEIIKFMLFAGDYKINVTDYEHSSESIYDYTLNGDDVILIGSDNTLSSVITNIINTNTTIGNQITAVQIDLTNQNSQINNSIISIEINLTNVNSSLGTLLTDINLNINTLSSDIGTFFTFTNNSFINLNTNINNSFIYMENNIWSINQSISTLVIGIDNQISILNGTITMMFTEMNNQFIITQSILNFSFAFLNQSVIQLADDIVDNQVILYNFIEQRANDIDNSIIDIQTLINLLNNSVADQSLVVQTLINVIGNNMTNYYTTINNLLNLIDNNITNNNIQLVSILELIGNNITTNHFVIETLLDVIGNNITNNHIELLTNLNLINSTIGQNQIELINRILLVNDTISDLILDLTNQVFFINDTIYTAVLDLSTSLEFNSECILGNITLTYQQNEFLTELYKKTMFSQLLNWSGAGYNYSVMEDRIDVWEFINNYKNDSITIFLKYGDLIDNLTISAQNTLEQFLPNTGVEYRLWSVSQSRYLNEWTPLPANKTVDFGFYETDVPYNPEPLQMTFLTYLIAIIFFVALSLGALKLYYSARNTKNPIPPELLRYMNKKRKKKIDGVVDDRLS